MEAGGRGGDGGAQCSVEATKQGRRESEGDEEQGRRESEGDEGSGREQGRTDGRTSEGARGGADGEGVDALGGAGWWRLEPP